MLRLSVIILFSVTTILSPKKADKIKMSTRKYFCFNNPVFKNMTEELSYSNPLPKEYI